MQGHSEKSDALLAPAAWVGLPDWAAHPASAATRSSGTTTRPFPKIDLMNISPFVYSSCLASV
jgi:hypothetical protein